MTPARVALFLITLVSLHLGSDGTFPLCVTHCVPAEFSEVTGSGCRAGGSVIKSAPVPRRAGGSGGQRGRRERRVVRLDQVRPLQGGESGVSGRGGGGGGGG